MFLAVGGGSVGFQIGGSFTDVVMLFMNDHALQSLLGVCRDETGIWIDKSSYFAMQSTFHRRR
jgi:lipid-binding SYLF domain-containing protein